MTCDCLCHTTHVHAGNVRCCAAAVTVYENCRDGNNGKAPDALQASLPTELEEKR
jgi:hypothetical protein